MLQKILGATIALLPVLTVLTAISQTASLSNGIETGTVTQAADQKKEDPALVISGSADVYYQFNFLKSNANHLTSFTQTHNSFALGMASLKMEYKKGKVGAVADLGFGQRAKDFSYTDEGITQAIKQLYISYSPTDWLKFSAGTWATHVGYELLDPQLNRNYSMSYLFTNGPFSHTGIKAELSKGKHGLMMGVANPTDYRIVPADQINKKFIIAQYSYAPSDAVKLYVNYVGGQNPDTSISKQFDFVITSTLSDKLSIGYNGSLSSIRNWDGIKNLPGKTWWGAAVYVNYDPKDWLRLSLRGELFSDKNQLKPFSGASEGGNIFAGTLSASLKAGGLMLIPELRIENSNKKNLFVDKNAAFTKSTASFLLAVVYSF